MKNKSNKIRRGKMEKEKANDSPDALPIFSLS